MTEIGVIKMKEIRLSKSTYCNGVQCPKMLWLLKNKPEEAVDTSNLSVLENGTQVGIVAQDYFGESTVIPYNEDKSSMVEATKKALESGAENIAEASFFFDNLYCAVDILHRNGDGWDIVEVKSSTSVKPIYVDDMSFQLFVLKGAGINVKNVYILYINNQYVRHGEQDLKQLFKLENYTEQALEKQDEVREKVAFLKDYAAKEEEPEHKISTHCKNPYGCAFMKYCRGDFRVLPYLIFHESVKKLMSYIIREL